MFKKIFFSMLMLAVVSCGNNPKANPNINGSFEGIGNGRNGEVKVSVVVVKGLITAITVLESQETDEYALPVFEKISATIVANNNINIDVVSGATLSSQGILTAVENALKDSGANFKGKKLNVSDTVMSTDVTSSASISTDTVTSASIVPKELITTYQVKGFIDSTKKKVLFVHGDPRHYSVQTDMLNTSMKFFEDNGFEVELRDLYQMKWSPILSVEEFYYQKDGKGTPPSEIVKEQKLVTQADYIVFSYPNWHDTPNAIVKGYMERVFASGFGYTSTPKGPKGLLDGRAIFTIMNAGFLGGGRGDVGDGLINKEAWDSYMNAFRVLDNDSAKWWGMSNLGRFVNDRTPKNNSETYAEELQELRVSLTNHLDTVFLK